MKIAIASILCAIHVIGLGMVYTVPATITETDPAANTVTITTSAGWTYKYKGSGKTGESVTAVISGGLTADVTDDRIIAIR